MSGFFAAADAPFSKRQAKREPPCAMRMAPAAHGEEHWYNHHGAAYLQDAEHRVDAG